MTQEDGALVENIAKSNAFWYASKRQNVHGVCLKYDFKVAPKDLDGHTVCFRRTDSALIEGYPDGSREYRSDGVTTVGPSPNILKYFLSNPALYLECMDENT